MLTHDRTLHFFCAHRATAAQLALARHLGFDSIEHHIVIFGDDPISDVKQLTTSLFVAVVAPTRTLLTLLRAGYKLLEFENAATARRFFLCTGGWVHTLNESHFVPSPISLGEQSAVLIRKEKYRGRP